MPTTYEEIARDIMVALIPHLPDYVIASKSDTWKYDQSSRNRCEKPAEIGTQLGEIFVALVAKVEEGTRAARATRDSGTPS